MNDALIGYTGFVGSNLRQQHEFRGLYRSTNIESVRGQRFETLVFSAAQAKKWWANLHPDEDWAGIQAALAPLASVRAEHVVLISTIDVLPLGVPADEATPIETGPHAYGQNRLRLERELSRLFEHVTIVRLPALFGHGLKKNVIFDLLTDNLLEKIQPESSFQYYDLTRLWSDIERARESATPVIHLFPEPLRTQSIVERLFPDKQLGSDAGPPQHYDYRTRYGSLFGRTDGYICGQGEVLERLERFVHHFRGQQQS